MKISSTKICQCGEEVNYLVIELFGFKYFTNQQCFITIAYVRLVLRSNFPKVIAHVKNCFENFTKFLVCGLKVKFLNHELMVALSAIYPNFLVDCFNYVKDVFH